MSEAEIASFPAVTFDRTVTIANGESLSAAVDLSGLTLVGLIMPAAWTAADLTFQASVDGTNFFDLYDDAATSAEVTLDVAASRFIRLTPAHWAGIRHLKIRSGASGAAVNQAAARTLTLVCRPV